MHGDDIRDRVPLLDAVDVVDHGSPRAVEANYGWGWSKGSLLLGCKISTIEKRLVLFNGRTDIGAKCQFPTPVEIVYCAIMSKCEPQ